MKEVPDIRIEQTPGTLYDRLLSASAEEERLTREFEELLSGATDHVEAERRAVHGLVPQLTEAKKLTLQALEEWARHVQTRGNVEANVDDVPVRNTEKEEISQVREAYLAQMPSYKSWKLHSHEGHPFSESTILSPSENTSLRVDVQTGPDEVTIKIQRDAEEDPFDLIMSIEDSRERSRVLAVIRAAQEDSEWQFSASELSFNPSDSDWHIRFMPKDKSQ